VRNGFKVYDTDTHSRPSAESIRPYLSAAVLERIPDLEERRVEIRIGMASEPRTPPYRHWYRFGSGEGGWGKDPPRVLGEAAPRTARDRTARGSGEASQVFMGTRLPTEGGGDYDPDARLRDMDDEGVDVHFIVHNSSAGHPDPEIDMEFVRAEHRFLHDFCGRAPHRLKSCIIATPLAVEASVAEIHRWGREPWAVAVHPSLPVDYPLDHPDLNPIWAAAQEEGLAVIHHSFSTGYPGYRDLWSNPFLGRLASHPWAAMRAVAAFMGAGLMDRFPYLRYGILESGFGWLPFWAKRMDDQAVYMGYVAENLEYKLSEYLTGGRFFAAIVLHEGEEMVRMVTEQMGDHILMFGSDYPHPESRFPESADRVLDWQNVSQDQRRKLLWDNAVRFFGEP
jgi:predicted TIM-barrel fold metal-dependent hydrolase